MYLYFFSTDKPCHSICNFAVHKKYYELGLPKKDMLHWGYVLWYSEVFCKSFIIAYIVDVKQWKIQYVLCPLQLRPDSIVFEYIFVILIWHFYFTLLAHVYFKAQRKVILPLMQNKVLLMSFLKIAPSHLCVGRSYIIFIRFWWKLFRVNAIAEVTGVGKLLPLPPSVCNIWTQGHH